MQIRSLEATQIGYTENYKGTQTIVTVLGKAETLIATATKG